MLKVSVIIIARDEEKNIEAALQSVRWADEIILVDSGSKDRTLEIVKNYTNDIYQREWTGFADQKRYALSLAKNEWVLSLDADERVSKNLKQELESIKEDSFDGYYIPRENYFLEKHITTCGWNNDYQLRFFRKSKTEMNNKLVHEGFVVNGNVGKLKSTIVHLSFVSIEKAISKINIYSTLQAIEKADRKKDVRAVHVLMHGLASFLRDFISLKGYKDGIYGLILSFLSGLTTTLVYSKIWELESSGKSK